MKHLPCIPQILQGIIWQVQWSPSLVSIYICHVSSSDSHILFKGLKSNCMVICCIFVGQQGVIPKSSQFHWKIWWITPILYKNIKTNYFQQPSFICANVAWQLQLAPYIMLLVKLITPRQYICIVNINLAAICKVHMESLFLNGLTFYVHAYMHAFSKQLIFQ